MFQKLKKGTVDMLRRLKILTLLQLSDRIRIKKNQSAKAIAAKSGLIVLAFVIITGISTALVYALCNLVMIPKTHELITFVIFFLQILSIVASTSGLSKTLYKGKDNPILLAYPARHFEVFLSKLLVFYIYEFLKSIFILLPLFLGFGFIYGTLNFVYIISTLFMVAMLPLFPVLIGAVLTMPILFITRLLNKLPIIKVILTIAGLVFSFWLIIQITSLIPVPLRIVALYNSFIMKVVGFITSVNKYALFYNLVGKLMMGENFFINILILLGIIVGLTLLVVALAMPLYFSLASKSSEQANQKKHKGTNKRSKTTFLTFVKKEWLLSIRNINDLVSNYVFLVATPYVLFFMVSIFTAVDRNTLGHSMTIGFSAFISLLMASASNTASALAITQEGAEFVLLKTVPADTTKMAWAKIFFNLIFSSIIIIISFVVLIIFATRIENVVPYWLLLIAILLINAGLIFWSLQIDIMNPKLREYAASGDSSSINNASRSILIGFITTILFTALVVIILFTGGNPVWQWVKIIGVALVFMLARMYLYNSYLKNIFPEIEF
jgi:ABC-2 type transport system permease protein